VIHEMRRPVNRCRLMTWEHCMARRCQCRLKCESMRWAADQSL